MARFRPSAVLRQYIRPYRRVRVGLADMPFDILNRIAEYVSPGGLVGVPRSRQQPARFTRWSLSQWRRRIRPSSNPFGLLSRRLRRSSKYRLRR